jgi:sulfite reductase alpha subunit-like flavoprotein
VETPVIFLAPGTGIAPMRSLIYHRAHLGASGLSLFRFPSSSTNICATENILFVGFRNKENDYLYQKEWEQLSAEEKLQVYTAFSRDQVRAGLGTGMVTGLTFFCRIPRYTFSIGWLNKEMKFGR